MAVKRKSRGSRKFRRGSRSSRSGGRSGNAVRASASRSPLVTIALIDAADKAVGRDVSANEIRRALALWATYDTPSIRAEMKRAAAAHRRAPSTEVARMIDTMRIAIAVRTHVLRFEEI